MCVLRSNTDYRSFFFESSVESTRLYFFIEQIKSEGIFQETEATFLSKVPTKNRSLDSRLQTRDSRFQTPRQTQIQPDATTVTKLSVFHNGYLDKRTC
jgi:hypothetical protein